MRRTYPGCWRDTPQMAAPKTRPTTASVDAFLDAVPHERLREDCFAIKDLMEKVTKERPTMWGPSMVGFGSTPNVNTTGTHDWFLMGFAPRKPSLVLYGVWMDEPLPLFDDLGPHTTGKSCLYIKRLSDVNMKVLERLMRDQWKRSTSAARA